MIKVARRCCYVGDLLGELERRWCNRVNKEGEVVVSWYVIVLVCICRAVFAAKYVDNSRK